MYQVKKIILLLVFTISIVSCSGEQKESSADALAAVYYLTFGVADGVTENLGGSNYTYESGSPGELSLKLEDSEIRSKVSHVEECRYKIERKNIIKDHKDQTRNFEIDFHTLYSLDDFSSQLGPHSSWKLNFRDGCAAREVGVDGSCTSTWNGIAMAVDEDRLKEAFAYFKKDVCPGQKF